MEKLLHALAVVLAKIGTVSAALKVEQRVVARQHKIWERAREKHDKFEDEADQHRRKARAAAKGSRTRRRQKRRARRFDVKSQKQHRKAEAAKLRAQPHIAEVKVLAARVHDLEVDEDRIRAELKRLQEDHGVVIKGNTATGGTQRQRVVAVALASVAACSSGRRANRYSQAGYWDVDHVITGEPSGARSDCSQWLTAVNKAAGVRDPNKNRYGGGFTGTLLSGGESISRSQLQPADAVIYGGGSGFHTELFIGPGQRTAGHGSPPIDFGIIDLVPGAVTRFRRYL